MRVSLEWLKELVDLGEMAPLGLFSRAGMEVEEVFELDGDTVFDIESSPVRGDLLGMWGIAREIAVFLDEDVCLPPSIVSHDKLKDVEVKIEEPNSCLRYSCGVVTGLQIRGETPLWIKKRLRTMDCVPQNSPVDIANYVTYETGQPIHLFDLNSISGNIRVRVSREGEVIETLDGILRRLPEGILLICDRDEPIAIAGIIGGNKTRWTEETRDVLVESAWFEPITVRKGARKLGISTSASYRFERGGDIGMTRTALERVLFLLRECYHGKSDGIIDRYPESAEKRVLSISSDAVNRVLGSSFRDSALLSSIKKLGFNLMDKKVEIPSYRRDITSEIDLVEEIARFEGYDNFSPQMPSPLIIEKEESLEKRVRDGMVGLGFNEVYTLPLTKEGSAKLINWMREDLSVLRESMIEGLLSVVARNRAYGTAQVRIFEIGKVFSMEGEVTMRSKLTAVMSGERGTTPLWGCESVDFFDMKGILESLFEIIKIRGWNGQGQALPLPNYEHGSIIKQGEVVLGYIGRFNSKLLKRMEIDFPVYGMELEIESLKPAKELRYRPISLFPVVTRDLSLIIDREIPAETILEFIRGNCSLLLEDVRIFDYYKGEGIEPDKVALGLSFCFRKKEGTLEGADIDPLLSLIIDGLREKYGAVLRDKLWTS